MKPGRRSKRHRDVHTGKLIATALAGIVRIRDGWGETSRVGWLDG
jgi:hypothetical protein